MTAMRGIRHGGAGVRNRIGHLMQGRRDRIEIGVHRHPMQSMLITITAGLMIGLAIGLLARRGAHAGAEEYEEEAIGT